MLLDYVDEVWGRFFPSPKSYPPKQEEKVQRIRKHAHRLPKTWLCPSLKPLAFAPHDQLESHLGFLDLKRKRMHQSAGWTSNENLH